MKKLISIICLTAITINCKAQNIDVSDISNYSKTNYILSNIIINKTFEKALWKGAIYFKSFIITDSKITPNSFSEGSDEVLSSLLISLTPDGDYYTKSNLYKIEGAYNPKILDVIESTYPKFSIKIEYGSYDKRITEVINLKYID